MPYSSADLVQRIAVRLGIPGDGQSADPESAQKIRSLLSDVVDDLEIRDIASFPDLDQVPRGAFGHLCDLAAFAMTEDFSVSDEEYVRLEKKAARAESRLRIHRSLPYSGAPVRVVYY